MTILLETDLLLFFGRFHSLIVHLPIGFMLFSLVLELIVWRKKQPLNEAILIGLLFSVISGILAITLGLMLASDGGYHEDSIFIHKYSAISATIVAAIAYALKKYGSHHKKYAKGYVYCMGVLFAIISVTGHTGGNLTHGSEYLLEHAPQPIRSLAGLKPARERVTNLDSAMVFEDLIMPILESRCNVCHNSEKVKGGLRLTDRAGILAGGKGGAVIEMGSPTESEIIRRVNLDPNHDDFMPTEGRTPLTHEETALLTWWIEQGASFDKKIVELPFDERIKKYIQLSGIGEEVSFLANLNLPSISQPVYDTIKSSGFRVSTISAENTLLEVNYSGFQGGLSMEQMRVLLNAKENITWLTLSNTQLQDAHLSIIGQMENLTRLRIEQNQITDEGIKLISSLEHLEYLNLYKTEISDNSVEYLISMKSLKKLFVWQTAFTPEGLEQLQRARPELYIESGS